jgi:hypothetical protein
LPFKEGLLIACKADLVELTAELVEPGSETKERFLESARERVLSQQYQAMTDPAILDPPSLDLASTIVCRDPIPPPLQEALVSLGFQPIEAGSAAAEEHSLFSRLKKSGRSKLDRWQARFLRAKDVSAELGEMEATLVDEVPPGPLDRTYEEASEALIGAARTHLDLSLSPGREGLAEVERRLLHLWSGKKGRLVLHPAMVRALAAYTGESIRSFARRTHWEDDEDAPLSVCADRGAIVRSDPELRVVQLVAQGRQALLSAYAEAVVRQSLTTDAQP